MRTSFTTFNQFLDEKQIILLDGGLATELEKKGHDLNHLLWSSRILMEDPDAIRAVHYSYLEAGADIIATTTYQLSFDGGKQVGLSADAVKKLLLLAVYLATESIDLYLQNTGKSRQHVFGPWAAASIGPYGAFLADGSEYKGLYNVSKDVLYEFHIRRWHLLADSGCDLIICETIPSYSEAEVMLKLCRETPEIPVIISFSCIDSKHISDGTRIKECIPILESVPNIVAIGVNCTAPQLITPLIHEIKSTGTRLSIAVYPNSGEIYQVASRSWGGKSDVMHFGKMAREWYKAGARIIGGCCRTGPEHIRQIKESLVDVR